MYIFIMKKEIKKIDDSVLEALKTFRLPRFKELPNVGLYLKQTAKLINSYLEPLGTIGLTESMISNYVKKKIIPNPVKKQYYAEHIARLIFIAMIKIVVSLDDIHMMIEIQNENYPVDIAYDFFCDEFENALKHTFSDKKEFDADFFKVPKEKEIFRNALITIIYKIYFDKYIEIIREQRLLDKKEV